MLDTLFTTFFGSPSSRSQYPVTVLIGFVLLSILALNASGTAGLGIAGVIIFFLLFLVAGALGWLWLSAALNFFAQLLGGQGRPQETLRAVLLGLWPLMLSAPAIAAARWQNSLGLLLGLLLGGIVFVGTISTLTRSLQQAHQLDLQKALLSVALTLVTSFLAWFGFILWPIMLVLGI
jgi:hypothetical protein